ncbi:hypothetical protein [Franconibacter daqui]|uniref:Uncharacterized protein n=1 Tax=Franconibacter daqui TaxID=2047724 RepID=A0ABV1PPJ0_9ENTR
MAIANSNTYARPEFDYPFPKLHPRNTARLSAVSSPVQPMPDFLNETTLREGAITSEMDFFHLATLSEKLVSELLECHDDTLSLALAGRLACALDALSAALERPIPAHLYPSLTASELSPELPLCLGSEEPILAGYCRALNMALLSRALTPELAKPLTGLLFDLVCHLCDFIKEPCFVLTERGYEDCTGQLVHPAH